MNWRISIIALIFLSSCTTAKLSVPENFSSRASKMKVSGLNGLMINQSLKFGPYQTSNVKRGWDFTGSVQFSRFGVKPEDLLLKVFEIDTDKRSLKQKNKFQYTIEDGKLISEIYATEKFTEKQLVYKSNNPFIGGASKTNRYEYAFTAAIVPLNLKNNDPWSLVLINKYDATKDTIRSILHTPYVEEEGYATNGKENLAIRPLRVDKLTTNSGKETKLLAGKILSGYEIQRDREVVGMIDILDSSVWLADDLDADDKLIVASVASAILLKRMHDVHKEKDELAD